MINKVRKRDILLEKGFRHRVSGRMQSWSAQNCEGVSGRYSIGQMWRQNERENEVNHFHERAVKMGKGKVGVR